VTSGYRVTVSFHLYKESLKLDVLSVPVPHSLMESNEAKEIRAWIASEKLKGKVIFPLVHQYSGRSGAEITLKGGDAALFKVLESFRLKPKIMFYYNYIKEENKRYGVEEEEEEELSDDEVVCFLTDSPSLCSKIFVFDYESYYYNHMQDLAKPSNVIWARKPIISEVVLSVGGQYGNEGGIDVYYGNVCIHTTW
jgi:hypothetical protein